MRRTVTAAACTVVILGLWAGCGGPRNSLNTAASVCFRSLPVAQDAVHHRGRLLGVRRVSASSFARQVPDAPSVPGGQVCLVAFRGDYHPADVVGAPSQASGRYAVVAVTTGRPVLLGARILDHLPTRFRHTT